MARISVPKGVMSRSVVIPFALGALLALIAVALTDPRSSSAPKSYLYGAQTAAESIVPRMHALLALDTMDAIPAEVAARTEAPEQLGKDGHWQPFGKEMCIINVDSRGHDGRVRDLTNVTEILQQVEYRTVGAYRNLMYAIRHGYSYHLVVAPERQGLGRTWVKIPQLYAILQHYRFVLLFDGDACVSEPRLPLHVLMNRWGFQEGSSLLLAEDPPSLKISYASNGKRLLNTGFILAQNTPKAFKLIEEWSNCVEKTEGCNQWAFKWAHEQTALTEYFRTEDRLEEGKDLIVVPCDEGNGSGLVGCNGILVTHLWMRPAEERMDRLLGSIMVEILTILENVMSQGNTVLRRMPSSDVADLKGIELLASGEQ